MTIVKLAAEKAAEARQAIGAVIHGQEDPVELLLIALATRGHALLEGVPGVGKTTLAKAVARVAALDFKRVQLTPDLMPTDVTGHSFYNQHKGEFEVRKGPAFTNILLADEINRAPPRTQSALLEVMEERQVTIDGDTMPVPDPFLVIATQNKVDQEGVYSLPEAQLDRFMVYVHMDYPAEEVEHALLMGKLRAAVTPKPMPDLVPTLREAAASVTVHPDVVSYILDVAWQTRRHPDLDLGVGPRGGEHLLAASRALAAIEGREFVVPDDVKRLAVPVLAHRLMLSADAQIRGTKPEEVVEDCLKASRVPVEVEGA